MTGGTTPRSTAAPSGSSSAQVRQSRMSGVRVTVMASDAGDRHHEADELQQPQRLVQHDDRERDREQRRQVAERAGHHRAERAVGREGQHA